MTRSHDTPENTDDRLPPDKADEASTRVDDQVDDVAIDADRGRRRGVIAAVVAGVMVVALAVTTGFTASWYVNDRSREHLDAQYIDTARQGVLNVISVSADRADRDVDRILASATGDFRADFASRSKDFVEVVKQMKVTSRGTVNSVGIESSDDHEATLLVSATSLVTNGAGAQEDPRVWRLRVKLQHDDDGILIEKVDFAI